jgi:hypothetical protein
MRETITTYHGKARAASAAIKKAVAEYKPEIAQERVTEIRAQLAADKAAAMDAIRDAHRRGAEDYSSRWDHIRGEDITPDAKLLEAGISMTQAQYDGLCSKYTSAGNVTMCKLLADYAERTNKRLAQEHPGAIFPAGYLTTRELPTPEANGREWERAARAAETLIDRMDGEGWMRGADDPFVTRSVEHFGENLDL